MIGYMLGMMPRKQQAQKTQQYYQPVQQQQPQGGLKLPTSNASGREYVRPAGGKGGMGNQAYVRNPQMEAKYQRAMQLRQAAQANAPDINTYISGSQKQLLDKLWKNQQYSGRPEYKAQESLLKGNALNEHQQRKAYNQWDNERITNDGTIGGDDLFGLMGGTMRNRGGGNWEKNKGYQDWKSQGMPLNYTPPTEVKNTQGIGDMRTMAALLRRAKSNG